MDLSTFLAAGIDFSDSGVAIPIVAICGGILVAIVGMITCTIKGCVKTNQTEQTRREIAAYVAEGSISPEDGAQMMKAAGQESLINM